DALKALDGRLLSLHLKDLRDGRDAPWGTGASDFAGQIAELKRQGFKGAIAIEYENITPDLVDNVAACVAAYHRATGALALRDGRPVKHVMLAEFDAALSRAPKGAAGSWPGKVDGGAAKGPGKNQNWGPEHKTPYRCKAGSLALYACGNGFAKEGPEKAFDGNTTNKWCIGQDKIWIECAFGDGKPRTVKGYSLVSANDDPKRDPRDWQLLGSTDGKTWTALDERKNERFTKRHQRLTFAVKTPGAYSHYKLNVSRNSGDSRTQLAEIEFEAAK
ncbi:discoidin domain-containing protein, partial [bacterium]|nr:discoidin domain-containing protein [bacterium]